MKLTINNDSLNKNKKFVDKIYSMGTPNPMGKGVVFGIKDGNETILVRMDLTPNSESVHLNEIFIKKTMTGKGYGNDIMKLITDEADKANIKLSLTALPIGEIPKSKLINFYKKHGFKIIRGDYMERLPK